MPLDSLQELEVSVYLFGSWARGEEQPSSDIDLGVMYETSLPPGTLAKLRLAFEEPTIPYQVEIVDLTQTDRSFKNKVMKEAIKWKG
ncbi:MAG TPA: nucleotidyltransferase domain-containing protein [Bacillales bacterium]